MNARYRPLVQSGPRRTGALPLTGGDLWFAFAERLERGRPGAVVPVHEVPDPVSLALTSARAPIAGLDLGELQIMGILNTTPDSFSDGGRHDSLEPALKAARAMIDAGASLIDVGGESTRPGAETVDPEEEIARTAPVIAGLQGAVVSIDTRKASVAAAAHEAGAALINDVSALTYDPALAAYCAAHDLPVCVMHAQGDPATMQQAPRYDDVLLDIYDYLETRVASLESLGIPRARILVDPGIGFGKTIEHNLTILRGLSLFHGLGCGVLLGVSRKGFIGAIGQEPDPAARAPGSIAVGLAGIAQGVQFLRVHDVAETVQAVRLWQAVSKGNGGGT